MQIMAVVFALCLATPALAQAWDPYGEILDDIFEPTVREPVDPFDSWDYQDERAQRQMYMDHLERERARNHALSACSTIWHNAAARAECRRSLGGE